MLAWTMRARQQPTAIQRAGAAALCCSAEANRRATCMCANLTACVASAAQALHEQHLYKPGCGLYKIHRHGMKDQTAGLLPKCVHSRPRITKQLPQACVLVLAQRSCRNNQYSSPANRASRRKKRFCSRQGQIFRPTYPNGMKSCLQKLRPLIIWVSFNNQPESKTMSNNPA